MRFGWEKDYRKAYTKKDKLIDTIYILQRF